MQIEKTGNTDDKIDWMNPVIIYLDKHCFDGKLVGVFKILNCKEKIHQDSIKNV